MPDKRRNENVYEVFVFATRAIKYSKSIEFPHILTCGYRQVHSSHPWAGALCSNVAKNLLMDFVFQETLLLKDSKRISYKWKHQICWH